MLFMLSPFYRSALTHISALLSSCKVMVKIVNCKAYYSQTRLLAVIITPFAVKKYKYALPNGNSLLHHGSSGIA